MAPSYSFPVAENVSDKWWEDLMSSLVGRYVRSHEDSPRKIRLDAQALDYLRAFCVSLAGELSNVRGMSEFSSKAMDHVVRLAIALHCLDGEHMNSDVIGYDQIMRACGMVVYFAQQHGWCWCLEYEKDVRGRARKIGSYFAQISTPYQALPCISTEDIAINTDIPKKKVLQAMQWMAARGWARCIQMQGVNKKVIDCWQAQVYLGAVDYGG